MASLGVGRATLAPRCLAPRCLATVVALALASTAVASPPDAPITPAAMQSNLAKGFDVRWAEFSPDIAVYTARKPRTVAGRGFSNVRVRVDNDLTDSTFAAHLDSVIHDALEANLTVILAKKGEDLKADPTSAEALKAYAAWWGDAAERYKDTSHRLMFDLMVEPAEALGSDIATLNKAYALATSQIRPSNPTRIIAFAPGHIASADYLDQMVIPPSAAPYAMVEWHTFAAGPNPSPSSKKHWTGNGTAAQRQAFEQLVGEAHAWQQSAPNGVPTWFGAWMSSNFNHGSDYTVPEQCAFATFVCETMAGRRMAWSINTYSIFFNATSDTPLPSLLPVLQILESC